MIRIILGAGLTGESLARYFVSKNEPCAIYDDKTLSDEKVDIFKKLNVEVLSLSKALDFLKEKKTLIFTSPGVPKSHPLLKAARTKKIKVISELEFSLKQIECPIIAITGTNGKSTVSSMCHHILSTLHYQSALLGNIGTPLSTFLLSPKKIDFVVLEISSYQLEQLRSHSFFRSVFINFSEDHLERHKTMKAYFEAKWKIFQSKNSSGLGFLGKEVKSLCEDFGLLKKTKIPLHLAPTSYYKKFLPKNLNFPEHEKQNAALSLQICRSFLSETSEQIGKTLSTFRRVSHRFETFAKVGKTIFIDDSKATNLDSTLVALKSLKGKKGIVFLGGRAKTSNFTDLLKFTSVIERAICFGSSSATIKETISKKVSTHLFTTLDEALKNLDQTIKDFRKFDFVLLSPTGSSLDEFDRFESRGLFFQKKILSYLKNHGVSHGRKTKKQEPSA